MFNSSHSFSVYVHAFVCVELVPDFTGVVAPLAVRTTFAENYRWEGGLGRRREEVKKELGTVRREWRWPDSHGHVRHTCTQHTHSYTRVHTNYNPSLHSSSFMDHTDPEPSVIVGASGESWGNMHTHIHVYTSIIVRKRIDIIHSLTPYPNFNHSN